MSISPELQAKIDALEDEKLRTRILAVLMGPGKRRASDEDIYESIVSDYAIAKEHWDRLRKWRGEELAAFSRHFKEKCGEDYAEFLRQEKELNEIEAGLAWGVRRVILEWMPSLDESDITALFSEFRRHIKSNLI